MDPAQLPCNSVDRPLGRKQLLIICVAASHLLSLRLSLALSARLAMDADPAANPVQWRILLAGVVATFVAFTVIFLMIQTSPSTTVTYLAPTVLAIAAAFVVGYRLTTKRQPLVALLFSSLVIPAGYLMCARLFLVDARDGWGALAYYFGTSYLVLSGIVGFIVGVMVNHMRRHDA
jgi:hypothetical protein